jgi:hypothetical protein
VRPACCVGGGCELRRPRSVHQRPPWTLAAELAAERRWPASALSLLPRLPASYLLLNPLCKGWGHDAIWIAEAAELRANADERRIERRAGGTGGQVALDQAPGALVELPIEVLGHLAAGVPAAQRHGLQELPPFGSRGEGADEHHPPAPQALLGRRQVDAEPLRDLGARPAFDVMENDGGTIDEGQPHERVLELIAGLRPLDDDGGVDRVGVVAPALLDLLDEDLPRAAAGAVDGDVVEDPLQPGRHQGIAAEALPPSEGADERLLHEVLGGRVVPGERKRETIEAPGLGGRERLEARTRETLTSRRALIGTHHHEPTLPVRKRAPAARVDPEQRVERAEPDRRRRDHDPRHDQQDDAADAARPERERPHECNGCDEERPDNSVDRAHVPVHLEPPSI